MSLNKFAFNNIDELKEHIKKHIPTFYYSSQTSTVIPYDKLAEIYKEEDFSLGDLSKLPSHMELNDQNNLVVTGPVSWKEAKQYLISKNRNIMTAPTEDLALITAGASTSATGERCFHFGNLRSQILRIKYLDFNGEEQELNANRKFPLDIQGIEQYHRDFQDYIDFKNAPFPRFETETDLMIGTEGQLGVITEIEIKTCSNENVNHLFMLIPKWEDNMNAHLEVLEKIQNFREQVILCELIDSNSFKYLPQEDRPNKNMDAIFFEIKADFFEGFYEQFLLNLSFLDENNIFEMSESKFHNLRASIPRAVFEENSRMGVVKMGTDVQVKIKDFKALLEIYQNFSQQGVRYNLFGHFGDAHLHFNFMPTQEQTKHCQKEFLNMYNQVAKLKGSPFAEHGIGIIKQKFIREFWTDSTYQVFSEIKKQIDPHNQFFPQGYMSLKKD